MRLVTIQEFSTKEHPFQTCGRVAGIRQLQEIGVCRSQCVTRRTDQQINAYKTQIFTYKHLMVAEPPNAVKARLTRSVFGCLFIPRFPNEIE